MPRPAPHLGWMAISLLIVGLVGGVGAEASELIFSDGFESGDFSAWGSGPDPPGSFPHVYFSADSVSVFEHEGPVVIDVLLDRVPLTEVSVRVTTADGDAVAGADFGAADEILTFAPGETNRAVLVEITDDPTYEPVEDFSVSLSAPSGAVLDSPSLVSVTIHQSDWPPFVYLAEGGRVTGAYTAFEQDGQVVIPVRLSDESAITAEVDYATSEGTGLAGEDYESVSGTLVFEPGETEHLVVIPILADGIADNGEIFQFMLTNPVESALDYYLPDDAVVTIRDDVLFAFAVAGAVVAEKEGALEIEVVLSSPFGAETKVEVAGVDGTAVAGQDYNAVAETLIFSPDTVSRTVTVTVIDDGVVEGDESLILELRDPVGAPLGTPATVVVTIIEGARISDVRIVHADPRVVHLAWSNTSSTLTVELERRDADLGGSWTALAALSDDQLFWRDFGVAPGTRYEYRLVPFDDDGIAGPEVVLPLVAALPDDERGSVTVVPGLASVVPGSGTAPPEAHPFAGTHDFIFTLQPDPGPDFVGCSLDVYLDEIPASADRDEPSQPLEEPYGVRARDELRCKGVAGTKIVDAQPCDGPTCDVLLSELTSGIHRLRFVLTDAAGKTVERAIVQDFHPWLDRNAGSASDYPGPFLVLFDDLVNNWSPTLRFLGPTYPQVLDSLDCSDEVLARAVVGWRNGYLWSGGGDITMNADGTASWQPEFVSASAPLQLTLYPSMRVGRNLLLSGSTTEHWGGRQELSNYVFHSLPVDFSGGVDVAPLITWVTPSLLDSDLVAEREHTVWFRVEDPDHDIDLSTVTVANLTRDGGTEIFPAYYADPASQLRLEGAYGWMVVRLPLLAGVNDLAIHVEDYWGHVVDVMSYSVDRLLLVPGEYPVPTIDEPTGRVYGELNEVLSLDGAASTVPPGYETWFAVLHDDGSDPMSLVHLATGLSDAFQTSPDDPSYRVRLVIATPESMPSDEELRAADLPCRLGEPDLSCDSIEVVIEQADLETFPFTTSYVFPDSLLLVWGGSSAQSMELERSSDGGESWTAFPEPGNQNHDGALESYTSYPDRTVNPGMTYFYRIKWNSVSEWFYLGNTFKAPGDPVVTPVWTASRPVPTFETVTWDCPENASRFLCLGTLTVHLDPEPGESLEGATIRVFLNEETFEAFGGDGDPIMTIWPDTFPFAGRDEPGCVTRKVTPDVEVTVPQGEDSFTINIPNVVYGANSFRFEVEDGQGGFAERALLYGVHEAVGDSTAHHAPLIPLLFGTDVVSEQFELRGLGPVGIRSPDCMDGDWRVPSFYRNDEIYSAEVKWFSVSAGRYLETGVGTDELGRWSANLSLSDGYDHSMKMISVISCNPNVAGHIGRSILAEDGSPITVYETSQEVCALPLYNDYTRLQVDTTLDGPHPPIVDHVPGSLFSVADDEVLMLPMRFRITDLHHDVDVTALTITNESLDPVQTVYGFYSDQQYDHTLGHWGWFVAEVPMLIPAGQTSWDNQLRVQGSDAAGNTLDYLVTVTRERPFVWAEIAEPDPPEAEPRQLVTFDGTASIVPALDELGGGVARWMFFYQFAGSWYPYRDPGFADGSSGLIQPVPMPPQSALKARLIVAASLLDFPADPWSADPPCAWNVGDGRCDSADFLVPLADSGCLASSAPLTVVVGSSVEDVSGERREEFHFKVHADTILSPIAYRWVFYDAEDVDLEWPVGNPSSNISLWSSSNADVRIVAADLGLSEGDYFLQAEARYPEDGCDELISAWWFGKSALMSIRINHEFGGIAPGEVGEGAGFRVYSSTWQEGQTGFVFIDDVVGDETPPLTYSGMVQPGGFVQILPDVFDLYAKGSAWFVSLAEDSDGVGRSVWWGGLKVVPAGGGGFPIQVNNEEDVSCGGVGTECTHPILPGQIVRGNWNQPGDQDYYGFIAGAGTVVRITLERAESGQPAQHPDTPVPEVFVARPDGLVTAYSDPLDLDDTGTRLETTLILDGYQQIVVRTSRGAGDYLLSLEKLAEGGSGSSTFGWTGGRTHLTTDDRQTARLKVPLIDGFGNPLSGAVVSWEQGEDCGEADFCASGPAVEVRSSLNGFAHIEHDPLPGELPLWRPRPVFESGLKTARARPAVAQRIAEARRLEAVLGYIRASSGAVMSTDLPDSATARAITERAHKRAAHVPAKALKENEDWCSRSITCDHEAAPVFRAVRLQLDEGEALVDVEVRILEGGVPTERLDGHEVMTSVNLILEADAVVQDLQGGIIRKPISHPVVVSVAGDRDGAIELGSEVCEALQIPPGPFTFQIGSDAGVHHVYDEPDGSPCCWIPTEILLATVVADVEVENDQGETVYMSRGATALVESVPRPADPCEVRFHPTNRPVVNTNRSLVDFDAGDSVSLGQAYLTDACGNVIYGVGLNDSEYHDQPGDEFRIASPMEPPEGGSGVWAVAKSTSSYWSFPLLLRGRTEFSATQIPDGTYTVDIEVVSKSQCSTGGSIFGSLTVEASEFLPQLRFHWDWDFDGEVSLRGPNPKYSVIVPGSTVRDASDRVAVWRVPAYDEPDPDPYFDGNFTSIPVEIYVARVDKVPFDWDGYVKDTYLEPVEGVVLCTGIVEEMTGDDGVVIAHQGPVRSTCDQTWTTVAEGFASSDPEMTNRPPNTWVPMGLGVGIVKAPEQPGSYVLVVEPKDEAFRRGNSWRIESFVWPDNFMDFEVGGGVYLDEEYERFGATIDVPDPRQIYLQASLDSTDPTLILDVEYTDPDDETTDTASVTMTRVGESDKGGSMYLSEPIELVPYGQQKVGKDILMFTVEVEGKITSLYLDRVVAVATIDNGGPVDLDIDGDNNNGGNLPDFSEREEDLETGGGYGKFVFVNHNDDDGDGVPDYADLDNSDEGNFVPVVLKIDIPDASWADVLVTFAFDGLQRFFDTAYEVIEDPRGITAFTGFFDHRAALRDGSEEVGWYYPSIRLWAIGDPSGYRYPENLVIPGDTYSAVELGFGQSETPNQVVFYVEAVNQGGGPWSTPQPTTIQIEVTAGDQNFSDSVGLTVIDVNLGVNNSSHEPFEDEFTSLGTLRPGVPDVDFLIDQYDEIVEDQGKGFEFWKRTGRNDHRPIDMFPMVVDIPSALQGSGYSLKMRVDGENSTFAILDSPSQPDDLIQHLRVDGHYKYLIDQLNFHPQLLSQWELPERQFGYRHTLLVLPLFSEDLTSENSITVRLVGVDRDNHEIPLDSFRLTLQPMTWLETARNGVFWMGSTRGQPSGEFDYPADVDSNGNRVIQSIPIYPEVEWSSGPDPDFEKRNYVVFVHGYNVNPDQAFESNAELYKRLWWSGYRGNYIGFTWHGDEFDPLKHSCPDRASGLCAALFFPNVQNAFQTSPRLKEFLKQKMQGIWGANPQEVFLLAHSLGNLVALDSLRLHSVENNGEKVPLVQNMVSIEAAVWAETFRPQASFGYDSLLGLEYSVDDLKRNSWAFWFNQSESPVSSAVSNLFNSYTLLDKALMLMPINDTLATYELGFLSGPRLEYGNGRGVPLNYRVPIGDGVQATEPENRPDLWFEIPPLVMRNLAVGQKPSPADLTRAVGAMPNMHPDATNIYASDYGWRNDKHSDFLVLSLPEIWMWYQELFKKREELGDRGILPVGEE